MPGSELLFWIRNPQLYGPSVKSVKVLQTHISYVALTGHFAYKIKKPVDFGFLDFSTLEKRKRYCEEEIRLNKRLCPKIYLSVVPITHHHGSYALDGPGDVVEYAVKMKEFPQDRIMTSLLQEGMITKETMDELCRILVDFYHRSEHSSKIDRFGELGAVKKNIDENFDQTQNVIGVTISQEIFDEIKDMNQLFFTKNKKEFPQRIQQGMIRDCHGDLHSGNIVVLDRICIFDCIEFNTRFRYIDVASDIGFLAMDLDYQNYPHLSSYLIHQYVEATQDTGLLDVLNFYKSYRAYVRGKVIGFQLQDSDIDSGEKDEIIKITRNYFELSRYYASLVMLELTRKKPVVFVVGGLTGTGKSTVAGKIAVDFHAELINTDVVRKEMVGIDKYEQHFNKPDTGLYTPENIQRTYGQVVDHASSCLDQGKNVVLDATFSKQSYRDLVKQMIHKYGVPVVFIQCVCPDAVVKHRLEERLQQKSVSDGRWEIYCHQKTTFNPMVDEPNYQEMDTANETYEYRTQFFINLVSLVQGAS
jgi:aminoglycoside phosphotransferase family enzyme/predicted kinase